MGLYRGSSFQILPRGLGRDFQSIETETQKGHCKDFLERGLSGLPC